MPIKKFRVIPWIFLIVGIAMLFFAYNLYASTQQFLKVSVKAVGVVVEMKSEYDSDDDLMYRPVIRYKDRTGVEHTFTSSTSSNPPSYEVGDRVELLYDQQKPEQPRINTWIDLYIGVLVLGILGGLFVLIPVLVLYGMSRRQQKISWLKENGKLIEAKVNEVSLNQHYKVNGQSPYIIVAQWEDAATNTVQVFQSDNIWFDPTQYVKDTIQVWIDPNNPKSYYVKTDFLPTLVNN